MWILGNGVIRWDRNKEDMTRYAYDPSDSWSLSKNDVRSICEDRAGRIWIGTEGGGLRAIGPEMAGRFRPGPGRLGFGPAPGGGITTPNLGRIGP